MGKSWIKCQWHKMIFSTMGVLMIYSWNGKCHLQVVKEPTTKLPVLITVDFCHSNMQSPRLSLSMHYLSLVCTMLWRLYESQLSPEKFNNKSKGHKLKMNETDSNWGLPDSKSCAHKYYQLSGYRQGKSQGPHFLLLNRSYKVVTWHFWEV